MRTARTGSASARTQAELADLVGLAIPLCLGHLGHQLMTLVDTAMLGRHSDAALGGTGVAGGILFAVTVVGMGIIMGLDTLVPQAIGAGRGPSDTRRLGKDGVRLALLVTLPISIVVAAIAALLPHTGVQPEVAQAASHYLIGRLPGIAPILLFAAMRSYLQAHQVARPMVVAMVVGNLVNVVLDWLLIFGDGGLEELGLPGVGLPAMGAFGAATTTSVVSIASATVCALAIAKLHREQEAASGWSARDIARATAAAPRRTRDILRIGAPVGLQLLAEVGIFALNGFLAGTLGRLPAAAHQVALVLASFSFSTAIGIGAATSVQVGRAVGANDARRARRAGRLGLWFGAGLMGAAGLFFLLIPRQLAALFTDDAAVREAAVPLLRIAALFQLSDAIQAVSAGALRGVGATRFTFVANLFGHYTIALPVALVLSFGAELGAAGLWWGLSIGLTAVAVAQAARFWQVTGRPLRRA